MKKRAGKKVLAGHSRRTIVHEHRENTKGDSENVLNLLSDDDMAIVSRLMKVGLDMGFVNIPASHVL